MSARTLSNASAPVEGDVIRIMREDSGYASAPIPPAVMSVSQKSVNNYNKHLSVRSGSNRGSSDERI